MKNVWQELSRPITALAPMSDVTDSVFRQIISGFRNPDLFYTEFVSADGLCHPEGQKKLLRELYFTPQEQPLIAQVFGGRPENIKKACRMIAKLGFVGVDINMGCPDRTIEKQKSGSYLIKNYSLAKEIIQAGKEGAGELPISVKTRLGYNSLEEFEPWAKTLIESRPASITFHLRTRKELSKVKAHHEFIPHIVDFFSGTDIPILVNGDFNSLAEGRQIAAKYNLAGIMFGRAIFGRPWLFSGQEDIPLKNKLLTLEKHIKLFADYYLPGDKNQQLFNGHTKSFVIMKKHFKAYLVGYPEISNLRTSLMEIETPQEALELIENFYICPRGKVPR